MRYLFEKIDNSQLVVFRIFFGLLMTVECWGAIATGWVKETFVDPTFTFTFIGFEWTQFLLGDTMYYVYVIMGFLGILIMIGAIYRTATILFFLLWGLTYLMQKSNYNNHYYLVWLISFLMTLVPANTYLAVDAGVNQRIRSGLTYRWTISIFKYQVAFVYIYAAIAKLYPDWIEGRFLQIRLEKSAQWFERNLEWEWFASFLREPQLASALSYAGIAFDFLIIPLLLIKPTRKIAFILAFIFHIFNSITLQIGIFPYFALTLCIFFFSPKEIRKIFLPFKTEGSLNKPKLFFTKSFIVIFFIIYVVWQGLLPLRHWVIPDDVLWTEEGHRLSWRMMLRTKSGYAKFVVKDLKTNKQETIRLSKFLTRNQFGGVQTKPDMMWQFAQYLKEDYAQKGKDSIQVFVKNARIRVNDGPFHPFINDTIDIAHAKWHYFGHQPWILPSPPDYQQPPKPIRHSK